MDGWIWIDGWMDGWMDGYELMDGWMDGWKELEGRKQRRRQGRLRRK